MKTRHILNRTTGIAILILTGFTFCFVAALAQKTRPTQPFMRQKLNYAQGILEGITLEKYDLVISNAALLRNMNLTNAYLTLHNPYYLENITNFQAKVDGLVKSAKDKNGEGAKDGYSQVVNSCISCHKLFRLDQFRERDPQQP
jgi:hypothetical protein